MKARLSPWNGGCRTSRTRRKCMGSWCVVTRLFSDPKPRRRAGTGREGNIGGKVHCSLWMEWRRRARRDAGKDLASTSHSPMRGDYFEKMRVWLGCWTRGPERGRVVPLNDGKRSCLHGGLDSCDAITLPRPRCRRRWVGAGARRVVWEPRVSICNTDFKIFCSGTAEMIFQILDEVV